MKRVADAILLKDSVKYTPHCLRRTGATMMAEGGASVMNLKSYGMWKSDRVAQEYVEKSALNKDFLARTLKIGKDRSKIAKLEVGSDGSSEFAPRSPSNTPTVTDKAGRYVYNINMNDNASVSKSACALGDVNVDKSVSVDKRKSVGKNESVNEFESEFAPEKKRRRVMFEGAVFNNCTFNLQ